MCHLLCKFSSIKPCSPFLVTPAPLILPVGPWNHFLAGPSAASTSTYSNVNPVITADDEEWVDVPTVGVFEPSAPVPVPTATPITVPLCPSRSIPAQVPKDLPPKAYLQARIIKLNEDKNAKLETLIKAVQDGNRVLIELLELKKNKSTEAANRHAEAMTLKKEKNSALHTNNALLQQLLQSKHV